MSLLARMQILAIAAVTDIAVNGGDEPIGVKDIAVRLNLPSARYLEPLLQALSRKGILTSMLGPNGGYRLARAPFLISVNDILRALPERDQRSIGPAVGSVAVRSAEQALSEVLQHLTIHAVAHSTVKEAPVVVRKQHPTRKRC
jgi:Rrf2 family protein